MDLVKALLVVVLAFAASILIFDYMNPGLQTMDQGVIAVEEISQEEYEAYIYNVPETLVTHEYLFEFGVGSINLALWLDFLFKVLVVCVVAYVLVKVFGKPWS